MDSHRALCQALCVLLCLASYTAGSDIVFTTTPSIIQHFITEYLTLRCSLQDAPSSITSGLVGKRHTFSDVTPRDSAPSDIKYVHSVVITKNGVDVATVTEHVPAVSFDNTTGVRVTGQVPGIGAEKGILQMDWKYPGPDQSGSYQCVISGIDQSGHIRTFSKTVDVAENEVSLSDLVGYIHQLKMTNDLQTATIENNTASITELNKKNADMQLEITSQTGAITDLKQRQDTHVLFTAGLDHSISVQLNGVVVFNRLMTSVGGGYSASTGVFTCPVAGYYMFHVHVMSQSDRAAKVRLCHNGNCVQILVDDGFDYQSGSNSASMLLRKGDTVKVTAGQTSYPYGASDIFSTFSGQLVGLL